jgi:replicative DNA helicase
MERVNTDFLEKLILKGITSDKDFAVLVSRVFEPSYFDDPNIRECFIFCKNYVDEYNSIPSIDSIVNSSTDNTNGLRDILSEAQGIQFDIAASKKFLIDQSNDYLKEKALKQAILDSMEDFEDSDRRHLIRDRVERALSKDIVIDLGLRYFEDLRERLRRIFTASDIRVPSFFPFFDEFISEGFPAFTLSVILAKIHAGKSNIMANFAARQVLNGKNVVLISLEMSEDAFAQRFDSIYSLMDINKMYRGRSNKRELMNKLFDVRNQNEENRGELFIKQFPTGDANTNDFRAYIRELQMRGINPDILYVDYINLMKASYKAGNDLYSSVKRITEELRSLSFEFKLPVISVSQINREGSFVNFKELDFNYVAESHGIPATADFMAILGVNPDSMVYENEIDYKIVKNRLGGRVGEFGKLYLDSKSLKMYDGSEMDLWLEEAEFTGDSRNEAVNDEQQTQPQRRRRRE